MKPGKAGSNLILVAPAPQSETHYLIEIAARQELEPFAQGQLDGLCGIYSAINAICLSLLPHGGLSKRQAKKIFAQGIARLNQKGDLEKVVQRGISTKRWRRLVEILVEKAHSEHLSIKVERPDWNCSPTISEVFSWIESSISNGTPVLICLENALNHFSVIAGVDAHKLHLFDSARLKFVKRSSCGIKQGSHHVPPAGLMRLSVQRRT